MSGSGARSVKKIRIKHRLRFTDERLRTRALVACSVVLMKTQWPHATANQNVERSGTLPSPAETTTTLSLRRVRGALRRSRAMRAEIHTAPGADVRNCAPRELATSLEVNRETGWRDNKLCRRARDIFSCLHFIGRYPATSNKRTNGLIRNNKGEAGCEQWGR